MEKEKGEMVIPLNGPEKVNVQIVCDPAKRAKETGKEQQVRLLHLTESRLTKEVHKK